MIRSLLFKYQTPAAKNAILMTMSSPYGLLKNKNETSTKKIKSPLPPPSRSKASH